MKEWINNIRLVEPYVPGEQPNIEGMIKLNTNENPYPPAPSVMEAVKEMKAESLRLYPDPAAASLVTVLADYYELENEQIFVGVGSDDVLAVAFMTFFNSSKPILFPDITYSFYDVWANLFRIPFITLGLDDNFRMNAADFYQENGGVVIANPNAPTSIYENIDFIEDILIHNSNSVVIVDEAYIDFGGESATCLLEKYENLLVVQTFSKSRSMAGIRIGYAMGSKPLIKAMNDVKYSFNSYTMNQASLTLGVKAVEDELYFKETINKIVNTREKTKHSLEKIGFSCLDSKTNFLFIRHKSVPAKELFQNLREHKIYVRYFEKPRIDNYLRVTIGTDEEMERFICATEIYLTNR